ncbi:MAG: putative peptidoglycan glycosyltransferase FtsW [Spirochaetia bacterium]|jgi:cell division protein FtsW|nr:putative peptidoglycan glycosyltransferase FtsW [Spirochaetia bacterium]
MALRILDGTAARRPGGDGSLSGFLGSFATLAIMGFVAMWSASSGYGIRMNQGASHFAIRQAIFFVPALIVFVISSRISLEKVRTLIGPLTLISLISLLLPFIPGLGVEINGARRWINIGITNFQPSELWKPVVLVYSAHIMAKKGELIRRTAWEAVFPLLVLSVGTAIIYLQDDFSTSMLALLAGISVFWVAGIPFRFFLGVFVLLVPAAILMITSSEYRLIRVLGYIIPDYDPHGMNYQVQNSIRAIMSGGFWGKGLGLGTRKLNSIPEVQSDFVFAAFAEETGLLGVAAVFAVWTFLVVTVVRQARNKDAFPQYLALGMLALLSIQFLVNLGVVSGFLPATGIALPFFSAGGSSLISTALAGGIILNALRTKGFEAASPQQDELISGGNDNE